MAVMLRDGLGVSLSWWWEPRAQGEVIALDEPGAQRRLAEVVAAPSARGAIRRFFAEGKPLAGGAHDDDAMMRALAALIAQGSVTVVKLPVDRIGIRDREGDVEESAAPLPVREVEPVKEEVCWPCLKAAASAQALRNAAVEGSPFVEQG